MKVLITGGAGFIGKHFARFIIENTDCKQIIILDNLFRGSWCEIKNQYDKDKVVCVEGDIRDYEVVKNTMSEADYVFHLAAQSNVLGSVSDIDYSFTTNVTGTLNVLKAAQKIGVKRIVFTSSREVYGDPKHIPVDETAPINPKNAYGASKSAAEAYCCMYRNQGLPVSILRLTNVYGSGDSGRVIPIFVERARKGLPLIIYGGEQVIDFVPVSLICEALWKITQIELTCQNPINIGSGKPITLQVLAKRILSFFDNKNSSLEYQPVRSPEVMRFVADVNRQKEILGLKPPDDPLEELSAFL